MKTAMLALAAAGIVTGAAHLGAGDAAFLQPGEYQVSVRLELPHVEDAGGATKPVSLCMTADAAGAHGLRVLSDSNPLRTCPVSNVRRSEDTLTFDIACAGGDAATGAARYTLRPESFEGSIAVKMGGKNMTMIERQSGRRVGGC
jgi:uncharacterized protein DUF3617